MNDREHLRVDQQISIVIDYLEKDLTDGSYTPVLLICEGLDVSAGGLKIHLDRTLPLQAIYQVSLKTQCTSYRLAVQTKWMKTLDADKPEYAIGLQILESADTDIILWKKWLAEQLEADDFDIEW